MDKVNKESTNKCMQCGNTIPLALSLYNICLNCLTKGKK